MMEDIVRFFRQMGPLALSVLWGARKAWWSLPSSFSPPHLGAPPQGFGSPDMFQTHFWNPTPEGRILV